VSRTLDDIGPTVPVKPPLPGCGGDQQLNILDSIPPGILAGCELLPLVLLTVLLAAMTDWPPLPHRLQQSHRLEIYGSGLQVCSHWGTWP